MSEVPCVVHILMDSAERCAAATKKRAHIWPANAVCSEQRQERKGTHILARPLGLQKQTPLGEGETDPSLQEVYKVALDVVLESCDQLHVSFMEDLHIVHCDSFQSIWHACTRRA